MDFFARVRNAFVSNLKPNLEALGITIKQGGGVDHLCVLCPFCGDKGGSGSLEIHSGYLKCFQCGEGNPLFDWVAKKEGQKDWKEAVDLLAGRLNVERPTRGKGKPKQVLDPLELEIACLALWEDPSASQFRTALEQRGFKQQELVPFHIGYKSNLLVFPHVRMDGSVAPAYHAWKGPWVSGAKWCWMGTKGSPPNYLWPAHIEPRPGRRLLLCEGEWDVLIARAKLDADAYTWTGGANSPLVYAALPEWAKKREWDLCYDNDVWQGPGEPWAPDDKKRTDMLTRRRNLIEKVGRTLAVLAECKVRLLAVPLDPRSQWGGDLRDAWTAGLLPNLDVLKATPLEEANPLRSKVYVRIENRSELKPEKDIELHGRCSASMDSTVYFPQQTFIDCPMGQQAICSKCRVPGYYGSGVIDWKEDLELQAQVFGSADPNDVIKRQIMGKPSQCSMAIIKHSQEGVNMVQWNISEERQANVPIDVPVFSKDSPDLSNEMVVKGTTFLPKDGTQTIAMIVDDMKLHEALPFRIEDYDERLKDLCPWKAETLDKVERYFEARYQDLAVNVTRIFGSDMLHLCFDLVAHSALRFNYDGAEQRAWIDAAIIGVTRSGKSQVCRRLAEHYGDLVTLRSTQGAFSAAGLLAMQIRSRNGMWRSKPGLIPQNHGKMLVLDEFHLMLDEKSYTSPIELLQEARDQGVLHIQKASSVQYKAAVRLLTSANAVGTGGFDSMAHPCEQLFELYRRPECISRLDFCYTITDQIAEDANRVAPPDPMEPRFTAELCTALMRRAWDIETSGVILDPDAVQLAADTCTAWLAVYSPELPLFTGVDKVRSILRAAIAIANLCYSHPTGLPMQCLVRRCHVQFAVQVYERLFSICGYGEFSMRSSDKATMVNSFEVEWLLLKSIPDPAVAGNVLRNLLGECNQNELMTFLNLELRAVQEWQFKMFACGAISRRKHRDKNLSMRLTRPANRLLRVIAQMADEEPDNYKTRRERLMQWQDSKIGTPKNRPNLDELLPHESSIASEAGSGSSA